jgi:site-specific DNA-methyltransferase (adenine-specific)
MGWKKVLSGAERWAIEHGSMLDVLPLLPDSSCDSCVCDPPYHLTSASRGGSARTNNPESPFGRHAIGSKGFMGRVWDGGDIAFRPETWAAVLRVLKPGAYLLAFGGSRTAHRIGCAIEDAGFEIRDGLAWHYASGMPKSRNFGGGIGTGLKPSFEPIIVARKKPEGTTTANHAKWGTGGLNIDDSRIAHASPADLAAHEAQVKAVKARGGSMDASWKNSSDLSGANDVHAGGRWPANTLLTHAPGCRPVGTKTVKANPTWDTPNRDTEPSAFTGAAVSQVRHAEEVVAEYDCQDGCPVRELDMQSGDRASVLMPAGTERSTDGGYGGAFPRTITSATYGDSGTASRFFHQSEWTELDDVARFRFETKASKAEKNAGLDGKNPHPTPKPVALLRYLTRLVTPVRHGIVLDPFCGSGSGGVAAVLEGFRYFGIELNNSKGEPFVRVARKRIAWVIGGGYRPTSTDADPARLTGDEPAQRSLF